MDSLILGALAPVFALILVGTLLRRIGFPGEALWAPLERLVYFVLFPCLLVSGLAARPLPSGVWSAAAAVVLASAVVALLLHLVQLRARRDGPAFTSVVQGSVRFNTYIGLALCTYALGGDAVGRAGVVLALLIPTVNVLSVAALVRWGSAGGGPGAVPRALARNPLVLACLAGLGLNALGWPLPPVIEPVAEILGRAALPLGLLAVGAGLEWRGLARALPALAGASALKLAALPLLTGLLCRAFGVPAESAAVAILFAALPTAPSAYILARQLGGDAALMARIITGQTLVAAITLPLALVLLTR